MNNYLIILNSSSGNGSSNSIYHNYVLPRLSILESDFNIQKNDLTISTLDIIDINGIIIIGGDGTVAPIIDFLFRNNYNIPICHIPSGSGNGLCKSVLFDLNKEYNIQNACDIIGINNNKKISLFEVILKHESKILPSFLSVSWGLISDIDIETEWLRLLGSNRFTIGGVISLIRKRSYNGILKYQVEENGLYRWKTIEGNFLYFLASNLSHISYDTYSNPGIKLDDEYIHITYIDESISRYELFWLLLGLEDGSHMKYLKYIRTKEFELKPSDGKLVVDGELIELQNINVKVSDKKISILG